MPTPKDEGDQEEVVKEEEAKRCNKVNRVKEVVVKEAAKAKVAVVKVVKWEVKVMTEDAHLLRTIETKGDKEDKEDKTVKVTIIQQTTTATVEATRT